MEKSPTEVARHIAVFAGRAVMAVGIAAAMAGTLRLLGRKTAPQTNGGWTELRFDGEHDSADL